MYDEYERHKWSSDESITSQKLNHLEEGISNLYGDSAPSALVVNDTYNEDYGIDILDKTWQEIFDAFCAGSRVIIKYAYEDTYDIIEHVFSVYVKLDEYLVELYDSMTYCADSPDGYPHTQES